MQKLDSQNMQKTEILSEKLVILSLEPLSYCIITKKYPSLQKDYTPYPLSGRGLLKTTIQLNDIKTKLSQKPKQIEPSVQKNLN